ncbi:hypothetical protein BB560_002178 [Smittium megazygosporum]|uniref:HMG box domain-containing protein n=1 Tax=Smittium megazygosporum TaxID=133381 RepID=A0A2T9ZFJ8_9FUNG|nr:hypothetical protein BB560_002178 [Smittium megazygosporum]
MSTLYPAFLNSRDKIVGSTLALSSFVHKCSSIQIQIANSFFKGGSYSHNQHRFYFKGDENNSKISILNLNLFRDGQTQISKRRYSNKHGSKELSSQVNEYLDAGSSKDELFSRILKEIETSGKRTDSVEELKKLLKDRINELVDSELIKTLQKPKSRKMTNSIKPIVKPPKISTNPFNLYCKDQITALFDENPQFQLDISSQVKILLEKWRTLSDEEKKPFKEKAQERKSILIKEAEQWWENVDPNLVKLENIRRKNINVERKESGKPLLREIKNPFAPKSLPTAYAIFVKDVYSLFLNVGPAERMKSIAQKWNHLSQDEKQKYKERFLESKKEHSD